MIMDCFNVICQTNSYVFIRFHAHNQSLAFSWIFRISEARTLRIRTVYKGYWYESGMNMDPLPPPLLLPQCLTAARVPYYIQVGGDAKAYFSIQPEKARRRGGKTLDHDSGSCHTSNYLSILRLRGVKVSSGHLEAADSSKQHHKADYSHHLHFGYLFLAQSDKWIMYDIGEVLEATN